MGIGSIMGIVASLVVGGAVASATLVGVIHAQTTPDSGTSPVNVSQPVVDYGTDN